MLTLSATNTETGNTMASLNKVSPQVIPMAPLQATAVHPSHFFITPNYTLSSIPIANTTDTIPGIGITSGAPWPSTALRPTPIPCYNPQDVFFNNQCILPVNTTTVQQQSDDKLAISPVVGNDLVLLDHSKNTKRTHKPHLQTGEGSPVKVKKEGNETMCSRRKSDATTTTSEENNLSYPVSALVDIPGSLTRASRTSSLSSSLSTVRFGGSLSQLWAASLSSLSGKLNNMKSTGNIHAEASLPSLGNQYFAFGGSLPELSLTSLSRLLPNSSTNSSTSSSISAATSSTNLLTVLQPPLYVYPSQPHLATPFINANGSITFGSFLSTGSSLCSTQKLESPDPTPQSTHPLITSPLSISNNSSNIVSSSSSSIPTTSDCHSNPPGSLNTLACVASTQENLDTEQYKPISVTSVSDQSPSGMGMSPSDTAGGMERLECQPLSPLSEPRMEIKTEDDEAGPNMGSYSEVKPYFMMMSPVTTQSVPCKKEGREKPYKCDYPGCGRAFSFPAHLKSHVQQIHISYRPCKCDFPGCGKRFYTPQHLNVHRRIHTGERPFVCPYSDCNKAFTTAGNLKNHIRTHTGERPYACKFEGCTKKFAEMSSLKKHELTHTGEKPYKCRVCGKAFSQAGSRNTHERKHNRSESDSKVSRRYRIKRVVANDREAS